MEYLKFVLYGLIQGLTEFIPVSSTAHLKVISFFLGIDDPGPSLSAIIQLGSVFALIWYFRKDIFKKSPALLYGGSVDGNNVEMFKKIREIDGFLIGGASKSSKKFIDIIKNYYR